MKNKISINSISSLLLMLFYVLYPIQNINLGIKFLKPYYLVFVFFILTFLIIFSFRKLKINIKPLMLFLPFLSMANISIFYSVDIYSSIYFCIKLYVYFLFGMILAIMLENTKKPIVLIEQLFKVLIIVTLIVCIVYVYKFINIGLPILISHSANMSYIGELASINVGFGGGRNLLASWIAFSITLPITYLLITKRNFLKRLLLIIILLLFLLVIVLTLSRTSLLSIFVFLSLFYFFSPNRQTHIVLKKIIFLIFTVICLILVINPLNIRNFLIKRFITIVEFINNNGQDYGVAGRFELWKFALKSIQENPVLGSGIGSLYHGMESIGGVHNYHNLFIQFFAQVGILGLTFFLLWSFILIYISYLNMKKLKNYSLHYQILSSLVFINVLVYYFKGMFMFQYFDLEIWTLIGLTTFLWSKK